MRLCAAVGARASGGIACVLCAVARSCGLTQICAWRRYVCVCSYSVLDKNADTWNFTYFFNVCSDTEEYPHTSATPSTSCETTKGSNGVEVRAAEPPADAWCASDRCPHTAVATVLCSYLCSKRA